MNSRAAAARIVCHVVNDHIALDQAFVRVKLGQFNEQDQRFIRKLSFGTIRWYLRLLPISQQLLHKPLARKHSDVHALLLIGLYQLIYLETPPYAAISETVNAVKTIKKNWATGLINKTLRVFIEQKTQLLARIDKDTATKHALPKWLVSRIEQDWPDQAEAIFNASNTQAPMTIRINPQQTSTTDYLRLLSQAGIDAAAIPTLPYAIQLASPQAVQALPGFSQGTCYIQDAAGQYAAPLLELAPGQRVLDACAAPGSKTTDILASAHALQSLTAIDKDPSRLAKIQENISRLQLSTEHVQLKATDVTDIASWWDGKPFDRILLDAPCSATGVIRRHPDIKLLRRETDIAQQTQQQQLMLNTLWPLLKDDGILLYSTCSILNQENQHNVNMFLEKNPSAQLYQQNTHSKLTGWQLLPTKNGSDGFYYAVIKKSTA